MKKILLILIIALAFLLRFYKLDVYPALNADEAAIGYNVYSLIQTGKDEHGNPWPIHFQSFNDYKPGLYFYIVLPFVKFIGLNEWSVRIPNAFLGVSTVLIIYLLVKEISKNERLSLIAALFLAISPWHIHFSRGGWEVNTATFFITLGVLSFLKAKRYPKLFILSLVSFVLSLYTYHAARIVAPLLGLGLLISEWKTVKSNSKIFLVSVGIALVLIIPLVRDLTKPDALSRAAGVGLFADQGPINRINEQRGEHASLTGIVPKLLHNKAVNYGLAFLENWGKHYWGEFLFLSGDDIQRDKVPETGVAYLTDLVFVFIGLVVIARKSKDLPASRQGWKIIVYWFFIAPIGAALTFQSPHALRAQNMVIPLIVISAVGANQLIELTTKLKMSWLKYVGLIIIFVAVAWQFARYEHMYWLHLAKEYPFSSQYGVKELVNYVSENQEKYKDIYVTDRYDQPYILFLFYMKYPPQQFQENHTLTVRDEFGFSTVSNFSKYHFGIINFTRMKTGNPNSLIIGTSDEIPRESSIIKRIYGSNGYEYFDVVAD